MNSGMTRASWLASAGGGCAALGAPAVFRSVAIGQPLTPLKLGTGAVEANAQIFYAQAQGFFKKNGLDVDIGIYRAGSTTAAAVIGGDLQAGIANVVSLGGAHLRGIPFVIFAPGAFYDTKAPTSVGVVAPNSPYKRPRDLAGTTVGGLSVGGLDQLALWAWVDHDGGDVSTLKFVELSDAIMAEALAQGRVSCCSMGEPQLSAAGDRIRVLGKAWDAIAPVFMQTAWFTTADWLAKNKDTAKRLSEALVAGGNWGMANPEQAPVVLEKYTSFRMPRGKMRFGERLDVRYLQPVFDSGFTYKIFSGRIDAAQMLWDGK